MGALGGGGRLANVTVEEIEKFYKDGDLSAGEKNQYLREKARENLFELVETSNFGKAVLEKTVQNVQEGWENLVEGFQALTEPVEPKEGEGTAENTAKNISKNLYNDAKMLYGSFQILNSVFDALGSVTGAKVEIAALSHGAGPGLAWWLGLTANIGTGAIIPVNAAARGAVAGAKATGLAGKVANAGSNDARFMAELAEALGREGITEAKNAVFEAGKVAGKFVSMGDDAVAKVMKHEEPALSFLETAKKYAGEVSEKTARADLPKLMGKFGISWNDLKTISQINGKGKSLSPEQFYGYLKAMEERSGELSKLARNAILSNATDVERTAFAKGVTELFTGPTGKLSYTKEFMDLLMHWDPKSVAKGDIAAAMRALATDLAYMNTKQSQKLAWKAQDHFINFGITSPHLYEIYRNILMPLSWAPAFVGNSIGASNMILERMASGHLIEASYVMKGMTLAIGDALSTFGNFMRIGTHGHIPGIGGRIVRFPTDSTIAMDQMFKVIMGRGSLYADALRASTGAANRGAFIRNYMQNPPATAVKDAFERAYRATYQNDLGQFGQLFSRVAQSMGGSGGVSPGSLWFTFMKSPINLVKYGWDRTPGLQFLSGRLYHDILAGGALADDAIGKLTLSNLQAIYWWELAKEGFITGSGPVDPALRQAWLATHQPYSVKTSKGYVPLNNMDPATAPIFMVADLAAISDNLDIESLEQAGLAISFAFMQNIANKTAWRTVSELVEVVQGREKGDKISKRDVAATLSPVISTATGGTLLSRTAANQDPIQRDARTWIEQFKRRVPGYSTDVPPMRDGYGDVIIPPQNLGPSWFGYFNPIVPKLKPVDEDPVKVEGARLQVKLPYFPDQLGQGSIIDDPLDITPPQPGDKTAVPITSKQRDRWKQLYSNIIRNKESGLAAMMEEQEYKDAPNALKRQMFNLAVTNAKKTAASLLMMEDVELGKRVLTNTVDSALPLMQPEERAGNKMQAQEEIDLFQGLTSDEKDNLARYGQLDFVQPDKPRVQEPVEVLGWQILGEKRYEPK